MIRIADISFPLVSSSRLGGAGNDGSAGRRHFKPCRHGFSRGQFAGWSIFVQFPGGPVGRATPLKCRKGVQTPGKSTDFRLFTPDFSFFERRRVGCPIDFLTCRRTPYFKGRAGFGQSVISQ